MYLERDFFSGTIAASTETSFVKDVDFTPTATLYGVYINGVFENADTGIISAKIERILGDAPSSWTAEQKTSRVGLVVLPTGLYVNSLYIPLPSVRIKSEDILRLTITIKNSNGSTSRTYNISYEAYGK
jgi:hypothetical protein